MDALDRFIAWLAQYRFVDRNKKLPPGLNLQYHSRSDDHSKKLGELIVEDLLATCPILRDQAARGAIAYGINHTFVWPNGKAKTLDLAIGIPRVARQPPTDGPIHRLVKGQVRRRATEDGTFARLLIACEEKAVMTEHGKSQPRIYSELNDSHTIVHQGSRDTIAAGITMVNAATTFISPLRQRPEKTIEISHHDQPQVTDRMVQHLRTLPIRDSIDAVGLDAYFTFVVDVDNQGHVALHTSAPAPQVGDPDHFQAFLERICRFYTERFRDLEHLPVEGGLSAEEELIGLAREHPGLLKTTGSTAIEKGLEGASELQAILESLERQANRKG